MKSGKQYLTDGMELPSQEKLESSEKCHENQSNESEYR